MGIGVPGGALAKLVHGIRHINGLVIRRGDSGVVQNEVSGLKGILPLGIQEPAVKLIAFTGSPRCIDLAASADTEVHRLCSRAPVQGVVVTTIGQEGLRMQEDTVLVADPLGIYRDTAGRHVGKGIGYGADLVGIPSCEGIVRGDGGRLCIVVARDVRTVSHVIHLRRHSRVAQFLGPVAVAIVVGAVHKGDGV